MKNIFKTSFHFIFLIIPLLILGACAKDITSARESTGGGGDTGGDGDFMPDQPFGDLTGNPPSSSLVGTWNMTAIITNSYYPADVEAGNPSRLCSDYILGDSLEDFTLAITSDGNCTNSLSSGSTLDDCSSSDSEVISYTYQFNNLGTTYYEGDHLYGSCYEIIEQLDSATLDSDGNLTGETKLKITYPDESCGMDCNVTASLKGVLDEGETSGSSGGSTGSETSGGTSGTSDGGSGSGGESSGSESGGSTTGDEIEESTISVESSQIVKDTFNATVEITNNTDSDTLLVDVILQKSGLSTGGPASSGASSSPYSFGRTSTLVAKTVTIAVGTTETKTLSFKIPENLSGTYIAILRLKYVDEDGTTQIVDTSEIIRNLDIE